MRMPWDGRRFERQLLVSLVTALLLGYLGFFPDSVHADKPTLEQIKVAIRDQGLSWTAREYDRTFATGLLLPYKESKLPKESLGDLGLAELPSALDWRDRGGNFVSPVKDQASCGSCWAFAGVGALESLYALSNSTPGSFLDLSEQILVSCSTANQGCAGGYMDETAAFLQTDGTYYESCFPYTATNNDCTNACAEWRANAFRIVSYEWVSRSTSALKIAVQSGPLQVAFWVHDDFESYAGGVYECSWFSLDPGGHAVLLVGYQDTPGQHGGGHFIAKNSWGADWGEEGYFRIGYTQVTNDVMFGQHSYRYTVDSSPGPTPTPSPTTVPTPVPYEPDDACSQASLITIGAEPQTRDFHDYGDQDWIQFDARAGTSYLIETSDLGYACDTVTYLYGTDCFTLIDQNDDIDYWGNNLASRIEWDCSTAGTYAVMIEQYWASDYGSGTEYALEVRATRVSLETGWNLASYPSQITRSIPSALSSIAGNYILIYQYTPWDIEDLWKRHDPSAPSWANDLTTMCSGQDYWIRASAHCLWEME